MPTRTSATLEIDQRLRARKAAGERVLHLGFGEAGLPVLPEVADALAAAAGRNGYGAVGGSVEAREAAAGYFARRGLPTEPDDVVFAPGSKALLYTVMAAVPGDVVLPQPSWVSYAAQAALLGRRVHHLPIPAEAGGVPDPQALRDLLTNPPDGARPGLLVLTVPDNPTGTRASAELLREVLDVAAEHGIAVISDEIYRDLGDDPEKQQSPASLYPERTVVTTGLSKSMALGGWRIGVARFPAGWRDDVRAEVVGIASEVWSSLAAPMQAAAAYVFGEPAPVVSHVAASRRLHRTVAEAVHAEFVAAGALCRAPVGPFYVYPDLEPARAALAARGVTTGEQLADHLLETQGVGVLAGVEFGDVPDALRFRAATSLLYGADDEHRWQALRSDDPTSLPWIADSLTHLRTALKAVTT